MNDVLLEGYIRKKLFLLKEENEDAVRADYTYSELHDFFSYIKSGKNAKKALKFCVSILGASAAEGVLDLGKDSLSKLGEESAGEAVSSFLKYLKMPSGISPVKMLAKFYGINDMQGLKGIAIPNNISNLIDDKVEEAFIKSLLEDLNEKVKSSPDEKVNSSFVLGKLKEFTSSDYKKTQGAYTDLA